jgi:hypothetical protein
LSAQPPVEVPALEDRRGRRQDEHRPGAQQEREPGEGVALAGQSQEVQKIPREQAHQRQIDDEDDDVQKDAAVGLGGDGFGFHALVSTARGPPNDSPAPLY